jgi:hypothetical protein
MMRKLTSKPATRLRQPAYPAKLQALADPDLLANHVPPAWLARAEIAGTIGVFLAANVAGCSDKPPPRGSGKPDPRLEKVAIVAPIFVHGEGRAADGCSAENFPVYLSEQQALQVITEELSAAGLNMSQQAIQVPDVMIPQRTREWGEDWITGKGLHKLRELSTGAQPLTADLEDPGRHVALKYISRKEHDKCGGNSLGGFGITYDFKETAQYVDNQVREQARGLYFAAFYDPAGPGLEMHYTYEASANITGPPLPSEEAEARAMRRAEEPSKRLLRQQVKDFVDWLKGQGVI